MISSKPGAVPDGNPLGVQPVNKLLLQFALPSIISTLVGSLYNMVDQIFIGQCVGYLGNAATTVAYPLTFLSGALTLLFSNGSAVNVNLPRLKSRASRTKLLTMSWSGVFTDAATSPSYLGSFQRLVIRPELRKLSPVRTNHHIPVIHLPSPMTPTRPVP